MRLIRSVSRPANIGVALQFQRCQVLMLNDTSNLVNGTNTWECDRSYAVSTASSPQEDRKPYKRISKCERRTMVETYVDEYRKINEGKFPSVTDTRNKVGGSYYSVRQIVQEMIYNSKQSSAESKCTSLEKSTTKKNEIAYNFKKPTYMNTKDTSLEESTMKEDEKPNKFEEVPQTREHVEDTRPLLEDTESSSYTIFQSKQDQHSSVSVEADEPKDERAQPHHPFDKPESSQDMDYKKKPEMIEDKVKSDAFEQKAGPLESGEVSGREVKEVPLAEPQKTSSMWNNLKSFANEIFSRWKRS